MTMRPALGFSPNNFTYVFLTGNIFLGIENSLDYIRFGNTSVVFQMKSDFTFMVKEASKEKCRRKVFDNCAQNLFGL